MRTLTHVACLLLQSINRQSKMLQHINYRMRVTISDQRHLVTFRSLARPSTLVGFSLHGFTSVVL